ncbi:HD domain-containing protein [Hydrotalea sp.]|uniref:HD domain-containing protein n=1 Tax=Hydrotalea sp. TaxID=2881279 RepID=UPI00262A014E|nr:HD domain-containing protein [Hydrotalea sp.]
MNSTQIEKTAREIIDLYIKYGNEDYIGEPVSQLEHMCQCAQLAEAGGYDNEVILAAFFHDIGHLYEHIMPEGTGAGHMDNFGLINHEKLGAAYILEKGFSLKIAKLIESHVNAKRYLTYKEPGYYAQLSEASKQTLQFQGGKMTEEEALVFEANSLFPLYIALRRWDEQAKLANQPLPSLEVYLQRIIQHLKQQN